MYCWIDLLDWFIAKVKPPLVKAGVCPFKRSQYLNPEQAECMSSSANRPSWAMTLSYHSCGAIYRHHLLSYIGDRVLSPGVYLIRYAPGETRPVFTGDRCVTTCLLLFAGVRGGFRAMWLKEPPEAGTRITVIPGPTRSSHVNHFLSSRKTKNGQPLHGYTRERY